MVKILNLEGINRVFAILETLCQSNGLTVSEVARATNISRGAANRYIYSLEQLGYILREHMTKKYFVSSKLKDLASYVKEDEWVETIAYPIMRRVGEKVMWPLSLLTLRGNSVVDLINTDVESPLMTTPVSRMSHYPIIGRSGAHVLLAGLNDEDIDNLLNTVANQDPNIFLRTNLNSMALKELITKIRRDGYGMFKMPGRNWAGISTSVIVNHKINLALSMRFHPSAVDTDQAVKKFLPILNSGAAELSANLSEQSFC